MLAELEEDFDPDGQLIFAPTILYKMLFGSHPAANLVTGTKASVQGITPAMLRAFHRRFYTPRNSLIVISSSRPHQQVAELLNQTVVPEMLVLQKSLDQDKASGANAKSKVWKYVRDNTRTFAAFDVSTQLYLAATDERIILEERNTDSSTISLQLQAMLPKMDSFKYSGAYRILTNVLFDSTLSMVFGDCRKAGLLYKIDGWMETRSDGTFFNLTFDVVPANLDKVVKKIAMALRKIAAGPDGVKDDFFQLAKQRAMYEFRKRSSDSSAWVASEVDNFGYWGHGKFQRDRGAQRQRTLDKIEQATKEDLVALARLVRASPRVAIYTEGPIANRRAFRNQIQQGFQAMLDVQKLVE